MYISKNKSLNALMETFELEGKDPRVEFKNHGYIVTREFPQLDVAEFSVFRIQVTEFPYVASFKQLKLAIDYGYTLENPTMIDNGYTIVKLHDELSLVVYYNQHEPDTEMKDRGFRLSEYAYKLGETGMTACLADRITANESKDLVEAEALKKMNSMCEESLDPEIFDKWEQVKGAIISTRKAFKTSG